MDKIFNYLATFRFSWFDIFGMMISYRISMSYGFFWIGALTFIVSEVICFIIHAVAESMARG
jgi:hypothetical protein